MEAWGSIQLNNKHDEGSRFKAVIVGGLERYVGCSVPAPNNTALGRTMKRKFEEALTAGDDLLNGEDFLELAEKFKCIAQQKGVTIELNNEEVEQTQQFFFSSWKPELCSSNLYPPPPF